MHTESPDRTVLRLRTAAGHLLAVAAMLEADSDRGEVLAQLTAVQAAVGAARRALVEGLVSTCSEAIRSESRADVRTEAVSRLAEALRLPLRVSRWKGDGSRWVNPQ